MNYRSICTIAQEISKDWTNPYFGAVPYLAAMSCIDKLEDSYICENGRTQVIYFLANASTWKGVVARRIKAELKAMLAGTTSACG